MARKPQRSSSRVAGLNRAGQWWLAAGALMLGVLVGAIIVGLLSEGSPTLSQLQPPESSTGGQGSPSVSAPPTTSGATAEVIVNDACLRAIIGAQNALDAFDDIGDAARTFNAAELDAIIRRLQPLRATLIDDVDSCEITTKLPGGITVASSLPGPTTATGSTAENDATQSTGTPSVSITTAPSTTG